MVINKISQNYVEIESQSNYVEIEMQNKFILVNSQNTYIYIAVIFIYETKVWNPESSQAVNFFPSILKMNQQVFTLTFCLEIIYLFFLS